MGEVECHPHADAVVHAQVLVVRVAVDQPINPVAVIIREEALPAFCGERFLGAACGKLRADADDYEEPDIPKRKQENAGDGIDQEPETEAEQSCEPGESDPGAGAEAEVEEKDGQVQYITKGDNNKAQDIGSVLPNQIEGVFKFKISRLGNLAMFVQTPLGMIVCLSIPIIIIILLQTADSKKEKEELISKLNKQSEMEDEIEKLKKQNEELMKK